MAPRPDMSGSDEGCPGFDALDMDRHRAPNREDRRQCTRTADRPEPGVTAAALLDSPTDHRWTRQAEVRFVAGYPSRRAYAAPRRRGGALTIPPGHDPLTPIHSPRHGQ